MKRFFLLLTLCVVCFGSLRADEGMWLPNLIGRQKLEDMRSKGFQLTAQDLYDINNASLKDAIVRFGGGCTGELVSAEGLLLTNHHCGYSWIQQHSTVQSDFLTYGFWATNRQEEIPNPGLKVTFLVRMDDVTKDALKGVKNNMTEQERAAKISENSYTIKEKAIEGTHYRASVEPFFYGNQYFLFVYEDFEDVRLVGAPPSAIGKFGGDTDNWMWPRHTGDFSVFRVYAGPDNKPAPYSPDNVPYRPKQFFTISTQGAQEGDFTFVYGFPGRTYEYVTSDAIDYVEMSNPHKIRLRTLRLDIMSAEQERDPAVRIQYASKHASVANAWKKWQGETRGLHRLNAAAEKRRQEAAFQQWARNKREYRDILPQLAALYAELEPYAFARDYVNETYGGIEIAAFAGNFARVRADQATIETVEWATGLADNFYKDYSPVIDRCTAALLLAEYDRNVPERFKPAILAQYKERHGSIEAGVDDLFDRSIFTSKERFLTLNNASSVEDAVAKVHTDPAMQLYSAFSVLYRDEIQPRVTELNRQIDVLYRTYMAGLMAMEPNRIFYPDANSTLRVSYGEVSGYHAADAVYYAPYTTIEGIMEKDDPEIYDYDVPQRLRELYEAKDYGRWEVDGTVPVCFIATNHTTGGNSGSPILNARGELLGLNFDRTWESTMSDYRYDEEICRNISVDIRYVMFVIDKVAGAGYLLDEMRFAE